MGLPAAARISGDTSSFENATTLCQAVIASSPFAYRVTVANVGLALIAVQKGDVEAAQEQYAVLESVPRIMLLYISTVRTLGLLAQTMGNLNQASTHFEDALSFCRKAGYRPELAWTCCDYADMLLDPSTGSGRTVASDRAKAMSLLEESLAISTELGMRPLMDRVTELIHARSATAPAYPDGLTHREVEVLRLVATGRTDREIAEELLISVATVSTHVRNLLNKTNAANRAEAAIYASRHDLLEFG